MTVINLRKKQRVGIAFISLNHRAVKLYHYYYDFP